MAIDPDAPSHVACRMPPPLRLEVLERAKRMQARSTAASLKQARAGSYDDAAWCRAVGGQTARDGRA